MTDESGLTFGVLLYLGANFGPTPEVVSDLTRWQADAAEALGYPDRRWRLHTWSSTLPPRRVASGGSPGRAAR